MKYPALLLLISNILIAGEYTTEATLLGGHFKNFSSVVVAPATSTSDFKTVDGRISFKSNMTCESATVSVAEVSYSGTSDIATTIKLDMNADGVKELQNTLTGISGICTDGVLKCNANTWANCGYFNYKYTSGVGISLVATTRQNTSNCYCINSSCGSPATYNKKSILDDITTGVYSVLQANMNRFVLTRTTNDGVKSDIYGENQDTCTNYQTGNKNFNQNTIVNDGELILAQEQSNPDSAAGTVLNATANENSIDFSSDTNALKTKATSITPATQNNKIISANGETFDMSKSEDTEEIKYCQIVRTKANGQIYTDETTAYTSNTSNTTIEEYELRECTGPNSLNCPYETGETVKYQCGTVNKDSFNESISGVNALHSMANDMSCSNN
jgi:hypothetical protein